MRKFVEYVRGKGHPNIRATHPTTLAVTRDHRVSRMGDCFLMVSANRAPSTLSDEFKTAAKKHAKILVRIIVENLEDAFECYGDPALSFEDDRTMVFRKSQYICSKTVGIKSNKSAKDIDRLLIRKLKKGSEAVMELVIQP